MAPLLASPPEALSYTPALESSQIVCIEGPGGSSLPDSSLSTE